MTHKPTPQEHVIVELRVTNALCSCGAEFVLSEALTARLSPAKCQDSLLDLYHEHRETMRGA